MPYHERHVDYGLKKVEILSLWVRPTIPWTLSAKCNEFGRPAVLQRVEQLAPGDELFRSELLTIMWCCIILIPVTVAGYSVLIPVAKDCGGEKAVLIMTLVYALFFLPLFIPTARSSFSLAAQVDDTEATLAELSVLVNGCSDE